MNALSTQQQQYSLRNKDVPVNPIQKRKEGLASKNDSSVAQKKGKEALDPDSSESPSTEKIKSENCIERKGKERSPNQRARKDFRF